MKSVLITGTSKGIGFETALALGRAGYSVFHEGHKLGGDANMRDIIALIELTKTVAPEHISALRTSLTPCSPASFLPDFCCGPMPPLNPSFLASASRLSAWGT